MLDAVQRAAEDVLARFKIPGLVAGWHRDGEEPQFLAIGVDAGAVPLAPDSLFPVASISKLAVALSVLRLVDRGIFGLDQSLADLVPDAAAALPGVTVRLLLSHTSGAPEDVAPQLAPYVEGLDWPALAAACLKTPLDRAPFTRVTYSNVGYGLLAIIVERQLKMPFAQALAEIVLRPLEVEAYLGVEPPRPPVVLADVRSRHAHTPLEPYNSPFYRSLGIPWGGLVTTAGGALKLARAFRGLPAGFLGGALADESIRNQADDLPGGYGGPFIYKRSPWGLGTDLRADKDPHWAPAESSPQTFGHAGASGAVAWCDPEAGVAWAVLGARTADNGWLLRGSPSIGSAILKSLSS